MEKIDKIIKKKKLLLQILEEVHREYGCLSKSNLKYISEKLNIPYSKLYGTVSFYMQYNVQECGNTVIRVCNGPSCHINGSFNIITFLKKKLKLDVGKTTKDGKYSLELSSCFGCCDEAPAIMIDDKVHGKVTEKKLRRLLKLK